MKSTKKEKRNRLAIRILVLFMIAAMLAGTFYYTIVFIAQLFI